MSIGKTIEDLNRYRRRFLHALPGGAPAPSPSGARARPAPAGSLTEVADFGPNPGKLRLLAYAPAALPPEPALVVVLHGCRQTAEGYDRGAGWSQLAEQEGFIVCLPEQRSANNPRCCFNWFSERETTRGSGEAASIHAMVQHLVRAYRVDRRRIFITGLSAGGAMTAAMLAAYPEVFAAGAIIAGLAYRSAVSVSGALDVMAHGDPRSAEDLAASVRGASGHVGPWPRLSVWHGTSDETVSMRNGAALVRQWLRLHRLRGAAAREQRVDGQRRRVWTDAAGREALEEWTIAGFGHGTPLDAATLGEPAPFILEAGISSTMHIARFFGIAPSGVVSRALRAAGL